MTAIALALGLAAAPAMAQDDWSAWDANSDGLIDNEEFNTGFGENDVYGTWDSDGDGSLTEDEFNTGVFNSYDEDGDGSLNEEEFATFSDDAGDEGFWDV